MPSRAKHRHKLQFIVIALLLVAVVFSVEHLGLFEGVNHYAYDLFFRLRGPREYSDRIVIASIDENTLKRLGRWPIARRYYADLLAHLNDAALVAFDIILAEPSEDDALVAEAFRKQGNVVLPAYIDHQRGIIFPSQSLSHFAVGHIHLEQGVDGIVRAVFHTVAYGGATLASFASVIHEAVNGGAPAWFKSHAAAREQNGAGLIKQWNPMTINYYGGRDTFPHYSFVDIVDGKWPPSFFKDKIVLVGVTVNGLGEGILTPLSQERNRMPGVETHANILNNLMDGSSIQSVGPRVYWILMALLALICALVSARLEPLGTFLAWLSALVGISGISYLVFVLFGVWLPVAPLYALITSVLVAAYILRLKEMQRLLLQAKRDWEESFDAIEDMIVIHDKDGTVVRSNRASADNLGAEILGLLGQRCGKLAQGNGGFNPQGRRQEKLLDEDCDAGTLFDPDYDKYYEVRSLPRLDRNRQFNGAVHVVRDVTRQMRFETEQQALRSMLVQAQKMEAIGTLAGGIAHDFNNILSAIVGNTELACYILPEDNKARSRLQQVLKASERAKDLIKQILSFSRQTRYERAALPLALIVKEAVKLLRSTLPVTIEIQQRIESESMVEGDPTQMHQIVMNLCTNAYHAMRDQGGVLGVALEDVDFAGVSQINGQPLQAGCYVLLTVSDSGNGISPEVRHRIFEPYFTTKAKGEGTGLGLATVHGIVQQHGGVVTFESELGKGTTFYVYLPRAGTAGMREEKGADVCIATGQGCILFVDDESEITDMAREFLQRLGYEVIIFNNPLEALRVFRANPHQFDLVITDMTMPKMTGDQLATEFLKIRPDISIILCTGYSENMTLGKAHSLGIKTLLMKPFTITALANVIKDLVNRH